MVSPFVDGGQEKEDSRSCWSRGDLSDLASGLMTPRSPHHASPHANINQPLPGELGKMACSFNTGSPHGLSFYSEVQLGVLGWAVPVTHSAVSPDFSSPNLEAGPHQATLRSIFSFTHLPSQYTERHWYSRAGARAGGPGDESDPGPSPA